MLKIKNLIFDFDGVIIDSVQIKTNAFIKIVRNYNKEIRIKFVNYHLQNLGVSRKKKIEYLCKTLLKKKNYNNLKKKLELSFVQHIKNDIIKSKFIGGILQFIHSNKNLNLFISSGTPTNELKKICEKKNIKNFFLEILGSPKTKKEHILYLKKKYKINDKNTLFFGDSYTDYFVAKKFKLKFVQVGKTMKNKNIKIKIKNFKRFNLLSNKQN